MSNPLRAFDAVILSGYQRVADYLQYHTGYNCFRVASLCLILANMGLYGVFAILILKDPLVLPIAGCVVLWSVLGSFRALNSLKLLEALHQRATALRNASERLWAFRLAVTAALDIQLLRPGDDWIPMIIVAVSFTNLLYFSACTPLPPGTRKPKEVKVPDMETQAA